MQNKYFNEAASSYALKTLETNPFEAKKRLEEYLDKYPEDYYARAYYVILLTRICMFKDAEDEYNTIIEETNRGNYYAYEAKRLGGFKFNLVLCQIKLLAIKGDYQQILSLIENHRDILKNGEYKYIESFCQGKLGILDTSNLENKSYSLNQIANYSEERFRNQLHIHEADYNSSNKSIFNPNFPLDEVINEVKKYIPSINRLFPGFFEDVYYFKYNNCGRVNDSPVNYFYVSCYHNTNNLITMYPVDDARYLNPVDLNYLIVDTKEEEKTSQIEKFNRRFRR